MPLNLETWTLVTHEERVRRCADLSTTIPLGAAAPTPQSVTLLVGVAYLHPGTTLALPPAEAQALRSAGLAT